MGQEATIEKQQNCISWLTHIQIFFYSFVESLRFDTSIDDFFMLGPGYYIFYGGWVLFSIIEVAMKIKDLYEAKKRDWKLWLSLFESIFSCIAFAVIGLGCLIAPLLFLPCVPFLTGGYISYLIAQSIGGAIYNYYSYRKTEDEIYWDAVKNNLKKLLGCVIVGVLIALVMSFYGTPIALGCMIALIVLGLCYPTGCFLASVLQANGNTKKFTQSTVIDDMKAPLLPVVVPSNVNAGKEKDPRYFDQSESDLNSNNSGKSDEVDYSTPSCSVGDLEGAAFVRVLVSPEKDCGASNVSHDLESIFNESNLRAPEFTSP